MIVFFLSIYRCQVNAASRVCHTQYNCYRIDIQGIKRNYYQIALPVKGRVYNRLQK